MSQNKRLGRGLEALLGPRSREEAVEQGALREVPVEAIVANPWQPRREFDERALQELTDSIKASGLLQPPVVRPAGSGYELIAGERRWRAVQRLGWERVPVVVRDVDDQAALTLALIENLQRDDLSAIDTALGYQQLMGEFGIAQGEVARLVGRDRSTVANTLRLLKLPKKLQARIQAGELSEGHARALLALEDEAAMVRLAERAIAEGWSVRQVEAEVRGGESSTGPRRSMMKKPPATPPASADARRVEDVLRQRLGTDVRLTAKRRGRGMLSIAYYSNDDLARVLELILGEPYQG
ncbi:MAG: ParB/RepB/Spo0J family partition protein [Gemmatimonadetes bacterium]|nr:ParB/RepB/Spo0J family partition protein [Gemmatimonadota bacterium]MCB9505798.1 ParB/RepB/Spo0J family partition protein [Gemmatimonadales bacterium]MCA9764311.1 ParB/RepB/Spo0J family partition protein [Gemmatimonadota bacterium]MCA9767749.1 ParB/RepB/Spo0J family partition protein [Gemmatimonadota bacterium]MCB9517626.1 ParB/RepB/Spo0J family partition protein [Gemmatimonadales bacterium]